MAENLKTRSSIIETPIGRIKIVSDGSFIKELRITSDMPVQPDLPDELLIRAERELAEYFSGTRRCFDVPVYPDVTSFEKSVYDVLCGIPYGDTVSYGALSEILCGSKRMARAVGQALGKNPILIMIPCHRVIGAKGEGGFSAGLGRKRYLLTLEKTCSNGITAHQGSYHI